MGRLSRINTIRNGVCKLCITHDGFISPLCISPLDDSMMFIHYTNTGNVICKLVDREPKPTIERLNIKSKKTTRYISQLCFDDVDPDTFYILMGNPQAIERVRSGAQSDVVIEFGGEMKRQITSIACFNGDVYYSTDDAVYRVGSVSPLRGRSFEGIWGIKIEDGFLYVVERMVNLIYKASLVEKWAPSMYSRVPTGLQEQIRTLFLMYRRRGNQCNRLNKDMIDEICDAMYRIPSHRALRE